MISMTVAFIIALIFFKDLFTLSSLKFSSILVLMVFVFLAYPLLKTVNYCLERFSNSTKLKKAPIMRKQAGRHVAAAKRK